jgi:hypothetical protein
MESSSRAAITASSKQLAPLGKLVDHLPQSSSSSRLTAGASGFLNFRQSRDRPLMQVARAVSLGSSPAQQGPRGGNYGDSGNPYRHVERELYVHVQGHAGYSNEPHVMAF